MSVAPLNADEALERIGQILGCKWSVKILCALNEGDRRPSQLLREWDDMAERVMHRCLNRLELDGLISKQTFVEVPPRVEYELTNQGKEFLGLLSSARDMSIKWNGSQRKVIEVE